jgi:hypothetical protein
MPASISFAECETNPPTLLRRREQSGNSSSTPDRAHVCPPDLKCDGGLIMPIKKIDNPNEIYQIKVTLLWTKPPIWRRLLVPATLTLAQLHDVLQLAMGWEDCHMHAFRIGKSGSRHRMTSFLT